MFRRALAALIALALCPAALAVAAEPGHGAPGLPQLDPSTYPSQLFWLAILCVVLYTLFARWTLPALSAILDARAQHIKGDLEAAQHLKDEAEAARAAYEAGLTEARRKAAALFAQAEEHAKAKAQEATNVFRRESAAQLAEVEAEIAAAQAQATAALDAQADALAAVAAERLLTESGKEAA
jgi:F-type H+-transporting ATPase subunit b